MMYGSAEGLACQKIREETVVIISIDTTQELTSEDRAILSTLMGGGAPPVEAPKAVAKKAAPAKKAAAMKEPESEGTTPDEGALDAAVTRASELLSNGERDRVMAALKAAGAPRVSEISAEALPGFLEALSD